MTKALLTPDFCIIGAGSGGLSFAAGAAQMGARVVLLEEKHMGGDCLNTGCVPSKALIAAAKAGYSRTHATDFGWASSTAPVDFDKVRTHIKEVIAAIAPHDSVERFSSLGVTVIEERGTFQDDRTVETASYIIQAKRFVIATGSKPLVPKIPGLEHVPFLTNETLFDLPHLPSHLAIIGGGPIGMEMAQAFKRLGSRVTVFEVSRVLPKDEPSMTAHLKGLLLEEGVEIHEHTRVTGVSRNDDGALVSFEKTAGTPQMCQASHLFVATGRDKSLEELGLEKAGVSYSPRGIVVRPTLQTTNPKIYALGDCIEGPLFTHAAGYQAGIALRNTIFGLRTKATTRMVPWVTYTDPELAHIGHTQEELQRQDIPYRSLEIPFTENDRAQADRRTQGAIMVLVTPRGKILGVSILGAHAGELIAPWILALENGLSIGAVVSTLLPYPTFGEISKKAAGAFYRDKLFSPVMRKLVAFLMGLKS